MAGAGFKTFTTGEVLLAADVNQYLMQQTVMVFDDASARATAIPTPSEGMFSYLKDTNLTYRYDGSAWLSDAGTTSPLTTKGDVWGYSTTDARIPVGANGTVLTADSAEALGVKWAAPANPSFIGASAYVAGTQSCANNTIVTADFAGGEDFDTDGFHSTSTNPSRMTIPSGKGGKYLVTGLLGFDVVPQLYTKILVNGNAISGGAYGYYAVLQDGTGSAARMHASFGAVLNLVANDYVQLQVYQNSGTAKNLEAGRFDIAFLGA